MKPARIISGGQTGVDRAALDAAWSCGLPHGGWCPKGRVAEDGEIGALYDLKETPKNTYSQRTRWNVRDSDGTLILTRGTPTGGTAYTIGVAKELGRPCLRVQVDDPGAAARITEWLAKQEIATLNVAGPRDSTSPGIYEDAKKILTRVFSAP